ncbi:MAG: PAS domain S-box protein [Bacteroidales bacterium]|nr:PAS domain S-box protein [Bacteroidales bacterium]
MNISEKGEPHYAEESKRLRQQTGAGNIEHGRRLNHTIPPVIRTEICDGFLAALMETIPGPLFCMNSNGAFICCNNRFENIVGKKLSDMEGRRPDEIWTMDDKESCFRNLPELIRQGERRSEEWAIPDEGDKIRHFTVHLTVFHNPDNEPAGLIGVMEDITGQQELEKEMALHEAAKKMLEESEKKYRAVFENALEGIAIWDAEAFKLLEANDMSQKTLGYSLEELRNLKSEEVNIYHDAQERAQIMKELHETGKVRFRGRHRTKSGKIIHTVNSVSSVEIGGHKYHLGLMNNITDLAVKEKELEIMHRNLMDFQENLPVGIFQTTPDGHFIYVNKEALAIAGYGSLEDIARVNPHCRVRGVSC